MPLPIPRLAPVTTATLPDSEPKETPKARCDPDDVADESLVTDRTNHLKPRRPLLDNCRHDAPYLDDHWTAVVGFNDDKRPRTCGVEYLLAHAARERS